MFAHISNILFLPMWRNDMRALKDIPGVKVGTYLRPGLFHDSQELVVTWWGVPIVKKWSDSILLSIGGHVSPTVLEVLNTASFELDLNFHVFGKDDEWIIQQPYRKPRNMLMNLMVWEDLRIDKVISYIPIAYPTGAHVEE
jgi:hypothetical protein